MNTSRRMPVKFFALAVLAVLAGLALPMRKLVGRSNTQVHRINQK
jgi:hypothetical protein